MHMIIRLRTRYKIIEKVKMKGCPWQTGTLAFLLLASSWHLTVVSSEDSLLAVQWYAPFFSGGGYCSEATSFAHALDQAGVGVTIVQHGDGYNREYVAGLDEASAAELARLQRPPRQASRSQQRRGKKAVVAVCHSEPGAWHPPRWPTARCPPVGATYSVGRTMVRTFVKLEAF